MTNRELVLRALNNQEVERVPVGFWFHFIDVDDLVRGLDNPELIEKNFAGHKKYVEAFNPDFIKIMSDGYFGYPVEGKIKNLKDLDKIKTIPQDHPWVQKQIALIKRIKTLKSDVLYFYNAFCPVQALKRILTLDIFVEYMKKDPEQMALALDRMAKGILHQVRDAIKEGGVDGIYLCTQNPDSTRIPDELYQRYISPSDKIVIDEVNGASENNILHICGFFGNHNNPEIWKDYPIKAYNWAVNVEKITLGQGKKIFGGRTVIGGFANSKDSVLYKGSKREVEKFTEDLIKESGKTGVIIGADCTLPADISVDRFEWVRQKAASL